MQETLQAINTEAELCRLGLAVIDIELKAIGALRARINLQFAQACRSILQCQGRVVVIGMGKSGHVGNKIAATLASTGTPAFFVHPGEASHGDLGMITAKDVVIAISNSGSTDEILVILPLIKRLGVPLIVLTGKPVSALGEAANVVLDVSVSEEACPLGLAPTASTTATLVMGDALAIALLQARGFSSEDFARSHPSGQLGRRLLLRVADIMVKGDQIPKVSADTMLSTSLVEMTKKSLGMTTVVDKQGQLCGIFTDGDLRRTLDKNIDIHLTSIEDVMTTRFKRIKSDALVVDALQILEDHKITSLVVVDEHDLMVGILHMHEIIRAKVV